MSASETSATPNADQSESWNGATGTKWVRFQERLDTMLAPFCDTLLDAAAITSGDHVLDIGCGCGATTIEASKQTGASGRALGIDLSAPMTERARQRATALKAPAEFAVADAYTHDFANAGFDLLISRFGVMFFDDPVGAFKNLHKALKPSGRMRFICWRELKDNEWISLPMRAARPMLPPVPPADPYAPGPGAFAEQARVKNILEEAGFRNVTHQPLDLTLNMGRTLDEALEQTLEIGPLARLLAEHDPALRKKVSGVVREELAKRLTPEGVILSSAAWIVSADA